jgi:radical SAM superfamily enzyme YgiQ (UPF0313 family)
MQRGASNGDAAAGRQAAPLIVLAAVNARYSHASLGARYLLAALKAAGHAAVLLEFTIHDAPEDIAAALCVADPALVGLGVYIWNRDCLDAVAARLRAACPALPLILGGPEIGHDTESPLGRHATCIVRGEAERTFPELCRRLLAGESTPHVVDADEPELDTIALPYACYSAADIARRTLYVESSRGCPFACDYCISALDAGVRYMQPERLFPALEALLARGARRFKLVDRTFNANPGHAGRLLEFFRARWQPGMQLHLEMTPQLPPPALREQLCAFPPGALHIELGIQTFNPAVARRVHRACDADGMEAALTFLVRVARAAVHADLIAGLPDESPASFESGFDRLVRLGPAELQVGILKRLHGAPLAQRAAAWGLRFRACPPYDVLATPTMDVDYLDGIRRFARHWERLANRGRFPRALALLLEHAPSPFQAFALLSRRIAADPAADRLDTVALARVLHRQLVTAGQHAETDVRRALREDYLAGHAINVPTFLRA